MTPWASCMVVASDSPSSSSISWNYNTNNSTPTQVILHLLPSHQHIFYSMVLDITTTTFYICNLFIYFVSNKQGNWICLTKMSSYPKMWMFLSYFILSTWFVAFHCGNSFNHIVTQQVYGGTKQ